MGLLDEGGVKYKINLIIRGYEHQSKKYRDDCIKLNNWIPNQVGKDNMKVHLP